MLISRLKVRWKFTFRFEALTVGNTPGSSKAQKPLVLLAIFKMLQNGSDQR